MFLRSYTKEAELRRPVKKFKVDRPIDHDYQDQRQQVLKMEPLLTGKSPGDRFHILSATWLRKWKQLTQYQSDSPLLDLDLPPQDQEKTNQNPEAQEQSGSSENHFKKPESDSASQIANPNDSEQADNGLGSINNTDLLLRRLALKHDIVEKRDFVFIPEPLWKLFHSWYGGGPDVVRIAREINGQVGFEICLLQLKIVIMDGNYLSQDTLEAGRKDTFASVRYFSTKFLQSFHFCLTPT